MAAGTFLHKTSTDLVRLRGDQRQGPDLGNRSVFASVVPVNLVRNRSLAQSISDSGWAEFPALLAYKAERYGRD